MLIQFRNTNTFLTCQVKVWCNCTVSQGKPDQAKAHAHCCRHVCKVVPLSYVRQREAGLIMQTFIQPTVRSWGFTKQNRDVLFMFNAQIMKNTQIKAHSNPRRFKIKAGTT